MSYLGYVALLVIGLLAVQIVRARMSLHNLRKASEVAAACVYASSPSIPSLAVSYSYSYPAFTVTFPSKPELQAAADTGLNESFKREIDFLCKGRGPKPRPFTAEQGVFFTYQGWLQELHAQVGQSGDA
jgi:hypothetical protein